MQAHLLYLLALLLVLAVELQIVGYLLERILIEGSQYFVWVVMPMNCLELTQQSSAILFFSLALQSLLEYCCFPLSLLPPLLYLQLVYALHEFTIISLEFSYLFLIIFPELKIVFFIFQSPAFYLSGL